MNDDREIEVPISLFCFLGGGVERRPLSFSTRRFDSVDE